MKTIRKSLTLAYAAVSIAIILANGLFLNNFLNQLFEQFARARQLSQIEKVISQLRELFDEEAGSFDVHGMEIVANAALQNGLIVNVSLADSEIDRDAGMHSRYPDFAGGYQEVEYDLVPGGTVTVGYYGPYALEDHELRLLNAINQVLIVIGITSLALVVLLAFMISRSITHPISGGRL